jgi:hypothetical protein
VTSLQAAHPKHGGTVGPPEEGGKQSVDASALLSGGVKLQAKEVWFLHHPRIVTRANAAAHRPMMLVTDR